MTYSGTTKTIETSISIVRASDNTIRIIVDDESSRNMRMIEIAITPEQFGLLVTGLSSQKCTTVLKNIEVAGKTKIVQKRSMTYTGENRSNRVYLEKFIVDNSQDDGWFINPSLGSQNSIEYNGDGSATLNYSTYRYE